MKIEPKTLRLVGITSSNRTSLGYKTKQVIKRKIAGTLGEIKLVSWCNVRKDKGVLGNIKSLDGRQQEWFQEPFFMVKTNSLTPCRHMKITPGNRQSH